MDYEDFKAVFSDVMPIIVKAAPALAGYLGSPATGVILALLGAITNTDPCDHCSLADKLKNDPDLYTKLQQLDLTHADWLKKSH